MAYQDDLAIMLRSEGYRGPLGDMLHYKLRDLTGLTGPTNQLLYDYLGSLGFKGTLDDRLHLYLGYLGYEGSIQDRMAQAIKSRLFLDNDLSGESSMLLYFTADRYFVGDWTCPFVDDVYAYAVSIGFPEGDVTTVNNTYFEYLGYNPLDSFNTNYQLALADNVLMNPDIEPTTAYFDFTTEAYFTSDIACPTTLYIDFRYGTYAIPGECPV
jgi:hypothetical protein